MSDEILWGIALIAYSITCIAIGMLAATYII